ncbi:hypothetical protein N658DRAFT_342420 [Parathielavia hyrcaniae]|uniref:Uncharacterized protein n=1 Tax=Parathielavia hyrcaniae TaxID=113614 RepID=A0AAN6Q7Y2_9PEZI|nr:hypothetical protein N658DRAFT_342420 [Parathielavia hyrcaniae]
MSPTFSTPNRRFNMPTMPVRSHPEVSFLGRVAALFHALAQPGVPSYRAGCLPFNASCAAWRRNGLRPAPIADIMMPESGSMPRQRGSTWRPKTYRLNPCPRFIPTSPLSVFEVPRSFTDGVLRKNLSAFSSWSWPRHPCSLVPSRDQTDGVVESENASHLETIGRAAESPAAAPPPRVFNKPSGCRSPRPYGCRQRSSKRAVDPICT